MKDIKRYKKSDTGSKFSRFLSVLKKVVKSKIADPIYDKDFEENSLRRLMKSPRLIVSHELNTSRVTGCRHPKTLPLPPDSSSVKTDPTEKVHKPSLSGVKEYLRVFDFRRHQFMSF